jgi:hypothetical protein
LKINPQQQNKKDLSRRACQWMLVDDSFDT